MDIDLDTLKHSISDELERSSFAIFRHDSGAFEPRQVVTWDVDTYPDYLMFLDTARKLGAKMILFASSEFDEGELEELQDELDIADVPPSVKSDSERTLKTLRKHIGSTSSVEIAFPFEGRFYVYEARPDWYEEFVNLSEEVEAFSSLALESAEEDGEDEDDSMGGFYSNN